MPRTRCFRTSGKAPTSRSKTAWRLRRSWRARIGRRLPQALLAYERLRRERVAQVQRGARENGLRYDSAYSDLGLRDAEIAAHAEFRKRLYDHDVVPDAQAAAATLA
jgi:salicylate hydroxylase